MAPPIPGLRPPAATRRDRTAGDVGFGLLAVILLAALTIGVPFALTLFLGLPIPHTRPSVSLLTGEISVMTILRFLSVMVWLAWLQLVWCVIVEIRAAVRNAGVPARVPLSGGTQSIAHRLVTAALLLFSAAAALSPAVSNVMASQPAYGVSAHARFAGQAGAREDLLGGIDFRRHLRARRPGSAACSSGCSGGPRRGRRAARTFGSTWSPRWARC